MGVLKLKQDLKRIKRELPSGQYCGHKAPLALVFEADGTLRREPQKCPVCELPRQIEIIFYLDGDCTEIELPDWLMPSFELAQKEGVKEYAGFDPDEV